MPLLDHFAPPLTRHLRWESFHHDWITMIVQRLNLARLSQRYVARGGSHLGPEVEIDVATLERLAFNGSPPHHDGRGEGTVATATLTYAPPEPAIAGEVEFAAEDLFEVSVYDESDGRLVAAIELVSPANKDRPAHRRAFAAKVASFLASGISVIVIDVMTERLANLHQEMTDLLGLPERFRWESPTSLYAMSYRMIQIDKQIRLEVWPHVLTIGQELPTIPLWLAADVVVPLELEHTYAATCAGLRIS